MRKALSLVAALSLLIAGACTSTTTNNGTTGTMEVRLTDAPITIGADVIEKAVVSISDISFHTSASANEEATGWTKVGLTNSMNIDLLTLQNDVNVVLGKQSLSTGHYQQLRFTVGSAKLTLTGVALPVELTISSGVLRLNLDVNLEANKDYGVILDFDAAKSLSKVGTEWRMSPVIKVKEVYSINADGSHTVIAKGSGTVCTTGSTCQSDNEKCCATSSTSNKCIDTKSNKDNCGDCGVACTSTQVCTDGVCTAQS